MIRVAALAYVAALQGLHVLLEGPSGCGLISLADFLAYALLETGTGSFFLPGLCQNFSFFRQSANVLLGPESTVENLIGVCEPRLGNSKFQKNIYVFFCVSKSVG
jgi:hypothetical protein